MGDAPREDALPPLLFEVRIHRQQLPPAAEHTAGIGFDDEPARDHVDEIVVGSVSVDDDDFLEAVIGKALADVEAVLNEMFVMDVEGSWKTIDTWLPLMS